MRMKLNKPSQLLLVSAAGLLAASLVTACSQFTQTLTVDFVYVASQRAAGPNQYGQIDVFEINSESGRMRQIPASPFPSGGRNPVAETVSTDYNNLFVANHDDNTVVQFVIGSDGKLYPFSTVNTPGIYPMGLAASKADLFVADAFQPLPTCSTAAPCSGSLAVYPLAPATSNTPITMQTPAANGGQSYWALCMTGYKQSSSTWVCSGPENDVLVPTGVTTLASGADVYVTAYDSSLSPSKGYLFGFAVGANGALTPMPGSPFAAGTQPSGIAADAAGANLYVTDQASADVLGYSITSGIPTPMTSGTGGTNAFPAGNAPSAIAVNPTYPYAYVVNSLDSTVTSYSISNGALTKMANYPTGTQPVAIGIDPSTNRFLFTANFLDNNVSGFALNTSDGSLLISQFSPFSSNANPTAVAAIPHNGTGAGIK
jgi:6-phosphogluconolactonase